MERLNNKQLHVMVLSDELAGICSDVADGGIERKDLPGILEARVEKNCTDQYRD